MIIESTGAIEYLPISLWFEGNNHYTALRDSPIDISEESVESVQDKVQVDQLVSIESATPYEDNSCQVNAFKAQMANFTSGMNRTGNNFSNANISSLPEFEPKNAAINRNIAMNATTSNAFSKVNFQTAGPTAESVIPKATFTQKPALLNRSNNALFKPAVDVPGIMNMNFLADELDKVEDYESPEIKIVSLEDDEAF